MASDTTARPPPTLEDLSKEFKSIRDVSDMDPNLVAKQKPFVSVVGLIRDYQPPRVTGGADWKMTLTIVDQSIEESYEWDVMKVNVFLPRPDMPVISAVAQPVLIRNCRVQIHSGAISLITNYRTEIHVFPEQIPTGMALPQPTSKRGSVKTEEIRYVAWLQSHIKRDAFPNSREFQEKVTQATNLKVKSCELKDARAGMFCDLVGEVIHMFDVSDRTTVYLTDYTSNNNFYNHVIPGVNPILEGRDGDDFGYSNPKLIHKSKTNEWKGPYGKMSVQLTAFDEHSERFREHVKVGNWVKLLNVHFEYPKTGGCLEAKLRTDRNAHRGKIQVEVLAPPENKEDMDFMWKNALHRKRDYQETVRKQKREFEQEIEEATGKRKRDDSEPVKMNGKQRRKEKRKKAIQEKLKQEARVQAGQDKPIVDTLAESKIVLNTAVRCHKQSTPVIPLALILKNRRTVSSTENGNQIYEPFVNANYRANLRVTDFFPHKLEYFSVGRKPSEFDCLSDYDPTSDGEDDINTVGKDISDFVLRGDDSLQWSWRFALQVEDASPSECSENERVWVLVDNGSGNFLLSEDAANLHTTPDVLAAIREKLFVLWGDLEERKSTYLNSAEGKTLLSRSLESPSLSRDVSPPPKIPQKRITKAGEQPPDSDDEMSEPEPPTKKTIVDRDPNSLENIKKASPKEAGARLAAKLREIGEKAQNKPFPGCIREYGVKVKVEAPAVEEENEDDDDDEDQSQRTEKPAVATKWERKFGLFGTIIV